MTKLESISSPNSVKNMQKYNERFPSDENINSPLFTRKRFGILAAPPFPTAPPPSCTATRMDGSSGGELRKTCSAEDLPTTTTAERRNTWSQGGGHGHGHPFENEIFFRKRLLTAAASGMMESRRSRGNSVPDIIEECESDEETDNDSTTDYDYIRCINCSRSNSTNSLDTTSSDPHLPQIINFCYKCKHLKTPHLPAFHEERRSSWTAGDLAIGGGCYSPRWSRKSSLTDSCELLPMISEPSFDDDTNDTKELQLRVKEEVDKLTKFNTNSISISRRKRSPLLLTLCELRETNI